MQTLKPHLFSPRGRTRPPLAAALSLGLLALLGLTAAPAHAAPSPGYLITDLGALPPTYPESYGQAVNNAGSVAGSLTNAADTTSEAFLYSGGSLKALGALTAGGNSAAYGINDGGLVVGTSATAQTGVSHAFVYNGTGLTDLTPGGGSSAAYAVNGQGQITGSLTAGGVSHAFLYDPVTGLIDLGTSGVASEGLGLAPDAKVVGQANGHSFVSGSDGVGLTDLGTLGGTNSTATGINVSDEVVGYSQTTGNKAVHAFFTASGGLVTAKSDLGVLTGGVNSEALGVNIAGDVVGYSEVTGGVHHAFLYNPNLSAKIVDLNTQLPAYSGWTLTAATGISDSGDITGYGIYKGMTQAFLLTPNAIALLTVSPTTVSGAGQVTGTVILAQPAPASGTTVALKTSAPQYLTVPATVSVAAGATTAQFTATLIALPAKAQGLTIYATSPGGSASTALTLTNIQPLLTFAPSSLPGGGTSTGTLVFTGPASLSDTTVNLTSSNPSLVSVPASVTLPANATQIQFTATTLQAVAANTTVTVTAQAVTAKSTYLTTTGTLTVTPTTITPFVLSPSVVDGGSTTTGVVTLSAPAPPSGAAIALHSSDPSVTFPGGSTLTIPSGSLTGTFTVQTSTGTTEKTATITATYNGVVTQTLDVKPTVPTTAAPNTLLISPTNVPGGDNATGTIYPATTQGQYIYFSSSNTNVATVPGYIGVGAGNTSDTFNISTVQVAAPTQVTITATASDGTNASQTFTVLPGVPTLTLPTVAGGFNATGTVTFSVPVPGSYVYFSSSNTNVVTVPGYIGLPNPTTSATFTLSTVQVAVPTQVTITATYGGASTTQTFTVLPELPTLTLPTTIGGDNATGTVTFSNPVPGGYVYFSSSNTKVVSVPGYIGLANPSTAATFTLNTAQVAATTKVTITATYGGASTTQTITVLPQNPLLVIPNVVGGFNATGTVTFSAPGPGGYVYFSSSNSAVASVPGYIGLPNPVTVATFNVSTAAVDVPTPVTITATYNGAQTKTTFTVLPYVPAFLSISPSSVQGGNSTTGTVTFDTPSPGGYIYFSSSNTAVAGVPGYNGIPVGATSTTFNITTAQVSVPTTVTISAHTVTDTVIVSKQLLVLPPTALSGFTPASGPVGTTVTISGSGFTGATAVSFNGTAAAYTVVNDGQITATVPAGATTGAITVVTPGGTVTSSTAFTVTASGPTISSFTPTHGGANTVVTLTGAKFTGATAVAFNGTAATKFTVNSDTKITVTVPVGATTGPITVTTPAGTGTSTTLYYLPGSLSGFSPSHGAAGTAVTITGTNFTGASSVSFNGTAQPTFTVVSNTQITTTVPTGATTGKVTITTPAGSFTGTTTFYVP